MKNYLSRACKVQNQVFQERQFNKKPEVKRQGIDSDLFRLQTLLGNEAMSQIFGKKAKQIHRNVLEPIRQQSIHVKDEVKQYKSGGYGLKTEGPPKFLDIDLKNGGIQLGFLKEKKKVVMVVEKKMAAGQSAYTADEKKVDSQRAGVKRGKGYQFLSNDWEKGAIALVSEQKKNAARMTLGISALMKKEEEQKCLQEVTPFLDKQKETVNKKNLQMVRKEINDRINQSPTMKEKEELNRTKGIADQQITKVDSVMYKKDEKRKDLEKRLDGAVKEIKAEMDQPKEMQDDFFTYIRKKWGEHLQENVGEKFHEETLNSEKERGGRKHGI